MENAIEATCHEVLEVGVIPEMISEARVIRLREFITDFQQNIVEQEAKRVPSTPPKLLEQQHMQIQGDVQDIKDTEYYCYKEYEEFSQAWGSLIENFELQYIA